MSREKYNFIPAVRQMIVDRVPGAAEVCEAAIDRWEAGEEPAGMFDAGVFEVCDQVRSDIARVDQGRT